MFVTVSSELALGPKRSGARGVGSLFAQLHVLSRCYFGHKQDLKNSVDKDIDEDDAVGDEGELALWRAHGARAVSLVTEFLRDEDQATPCALFDLLDNETLNTGQI